MEKKNLEREITEEQMFDLIRSAESLQHAEEIKPKIEGKIDELAAIRQALQEPMNRGDRTSLNLGMAYELAQEECKIDSRFMDQALKFHYLSREQQLMDIENYGAIPSYELIERVCNRELLKSLRDFSPLERFDITEGRQSNLHFDSFYSHFAKVEEKERERLIRKPKKVEVYHNLVKFRPLRLENGGIVYIFDLENPFFLSVCGDTLKELKNERFKKGKLFDYEIRHYYDPEGSE